MKITKRIAAVILVMIVALSFVSCSKSKVDNETRLGQSINSAGKYLSRKILDPKYGDEDALIGLIRSGYIDHWNDRASKYQTSMNVMIKNNGYRLGKKGKEFADAYPKVIYAFTACGILADKTSNMDLTQGISYDNVVMQGGYLNKINALSAIECGGHGEFEYQMYEKGDLTREDLINFVLSLQQEDGSFSYKGNTESVLCITSSAVIALSLTEKTPEIEKAIAEGVKYIKANAKPTDSIADLQVEIIALNSAGEDAMYLVEGLMLHQYSDGSFAENTTDKKGNEADTGLAISALASQYRFENGLTSLYDMSDVVGVAHNKLSPRWQRYVKFMECALVVILTALATLFVVSRIRIAKWRADGTYDEKNGRRKLSVDATAQEVVDYTNSEKVDIYEEEPDEAEQIPEEKTDEEAAAEETEEPTEKTEE